MHTDNAGKIDMHCLYDSASRILFKVPREVVGMIEQVILVGDVLERLATIPDGSVDCLVTSPPYWGLRDYGHVGQIGQEDSPYAWCETLVEVFSECRRVLAEHGTFWLNIGDSYANRADLYIKPKDMVGQPWMLAFALRADGWYLRSEIIWHKPNPMPESVRDRPTKAHEQLFLLSKRSRYYYDAEAIKEPGTGRTDRWPGSKGRLGGNKGSHGTRSTGTAGVGVNARTVWRIAPSTYRGAHFATFPEELPKRCISAGCPERVCRECGSPSTRIVECAKTVGWSDCGHNDWRPGLVLDPFAGSGTTLLVARRLNRSGIGIELNPVYADLARQRMGNVTL